jgi:alpha-N-arabinofuranosidase
MNRKGNRALALVFATLAAFGIEAMAQAGDTVTIRVDAQASGPVLSRHLFGQFAEHLGTGIYGGVWVGEGSPIPNVRGIRSDVVAALRELRVPNVRWPGGCFADEYHWREGVGPQRRTRINNNWGGVPESNEFGTHEFFDFVEQIGSQAFVSVNLGSGTVQEASDWLEYMTADERSSLGAERIANGREAPFDLHFAGIGNEAWGCGGSMTPEFYVDQMKMYARMLRNYNPAQLEAPNVMQRVAVGPDGGDPDGGYTEAVMAAWQDKVWSWDIEAISLHFYTNESTWPPRFDSEEFDEDGYAELVEDTLRMDGLIAQHSAVMDQHDPEKRIAMMVDEWGVWLKPLPGTDAGFLAQQNSMRDAVIAALNINIFARHAERVRGANIAQMVNVLQAMILTDGPRMVLTPTYHVFHLYRPFQDATFVPVSFDAGTYTHGEWSMPRVDAIAARDAQGTLWLAVTNVDPNSAATLRIEVDGLQVTSATGKVLTASQVNSRNTFEVPDAVQPQTVTVQAQGDVLTLEVPGKSVLVVQLN